mgnify:CR=1 FL=1
MKKFIRNNKAICFMLLIIIACVGVSVGLLLKYFYFGNGGSKYGDRLDGIEAVLIADDKKNEVANSLKEGKNVKDATVTVTGKIIYIRIAFEAGADLETSKSIAVKSLEQFSEDEKKFYDVHFTLVSDKNESSDGFTIMGSKNVNGTNLIWNNNNPVSDDGE